MMTLDSAWRQLRGATRDQATADERVAGARKVWLMTLLEQMAERLEEARDLGVDVTAEKGLLSIGVPCTKCMTIVTAKTRGVKHKIFLGGKDSPAVYAECDRLPIDALPDKDGNAAAMPEWPPLPKPVIE
jgi:hypothetical protein